MLLVAITGMPGAGKSTVAHALEGRGLKKVVMGDVIREETAKRGLALNSENTGAVMKELREKYGESAVAELCLKKLREIHDDAVIVDGIRSMAEVDVFRREYDVLLLAIHASRKRRYQLLKDRGRSDDPLDWDTFVARDERELSVGLGKAMALADEILSNEHSKPEELADRVIELVEGWTRSVRGRS